MDEEARQEMDDLTISNGERMATLAHRNIRVDVQQLMIRHLVETLFPTEEERAEVNLSFQKLIASVLTEAEERADELVLAASAVRQTGLIVPGGVG